jgi:hypothetical protein
MSLRNAFVSLVLPLAFVVGGSCPVVAADLGCRVTSIRGNLYLHQEGKFSQDDVFSGKIPLWNTMGTSHALLVLVDIDGMSPDGPTRGTISLSVKTREGQTIGRQDLDLAYFSGGDRHRATIPMLVYPGMCSPIFAEAVLKSGGQKQTTRSGTAPFACGE